MHQLGLILLKKNILNQGQPPLASHAGDFRGAHISSLPTNACLTKNNIPFHCFICMVSDQSTVVQ